ncbi:MAG: nucleotide exchange factor GrpE [Lachnospiraceae bacterium]|nr:nucleotide exchange factor GrpE [Lachnospiraceae bacterium]
MAETEKDLDQDIVDNQAEAVSGHAGEKNGAAQDAANPQPEDTAEASESGADDSQEAGEEAEAKESGNETSGDGAASGSAKEKESFFSKKDKNKEKDKDKERIAELEDRVMRQMAEFENFRRRTEKEKQQMFETGARSVIEKILPVVDNFERGLSSIPEAERQGAVAEGMNMIYKQLLTELDNIGVKAIEAVGEEFDPAKHNAVMQVASEEYESGIVAQELQKGYTYRDTVIRHSMVAVVE